MFDFFYRQRGIYLFIIYSTYIEETALLTLDADMSENLEDLISEDEVVKAIASAPTEKSPGPDGLRPTFFKQFASFLTAFLTKVFNSLTEGYRFSTQTLEAHISLIPKPGKDPSNCANYRPISLIGVDLKIFTKVLDNRLQPLLPGLIQIRLVS